MILRYKSDTNSLDVKGTVIDDQHSDVWVVHKREDFSQFIAMFMGNIWGK